MTAEFGQFALVLAFVAGGFALASSWLGFALPRRATAALLAGMPFLHLPLGLVAAFAFGHCIATQDGSVAAVAAHGAPDLSLTSVTAIVWESRSAALLASFIVTSLAAAALFGARVYLRADADPAMGLTANLVALSFLSIMLFAYSPFARVEPSADLQNAAVVRGRPSLMSGEAMPAFDLPALPGSGNPGLSNTSLSGKVTLLNIFASWCPSCLEEHPQLMTIASEAAVALVAINWKDKPGQGARFLVQHQNPYAAIGNDPVGTTGARLGVTGVPETLIIDKQGVLRHRVIGPLTREIWLNDIRPLIERLQRSQ